MIGIYKIISPSNKIYVGQTTDFERRFKEYKGLHNIKGQPRLRNSFIKYGTNNHIFEIIEECDINLLNERERYYQDYYNVIGKNGLNCKLTNTKDKSGILSKKTKLKISKSHIGKKCSEEHKKNIGLSKKGIKLSEQHIDKIRKGNQGKIISEEHKEALRKARKNETNCNVGKKGNEHHASKKVICTVSNKVWNSISECSIELKITTSILSRYLNGTRKNKTTIKYLNNE